MKTLYLVRHAKSSWQEHGLSDFDRPLNKRGFSAANVMGNKLNEKGVKPDLIISSPAKRALLTSTIFAENLNFNTDKIEFNPAVYGAGINELLTIVSAIGNNNIKVMLFGHEPTMSYFTNFLSGQNIDKFSTAGVAKINFNINDWSGISRQLGNLEYFIYPKMFD